MREATIVRPMNAKAGEKYMPVAKITQAQNLEIIRTWRKQTSSVPTISRISNGPRLIITAGKKKNHPGE